MADQNPCLPQEKNISQFVQPEPFSLSFSLSRGRETWGCSRLALLTTVADLPHEPQTKNHRYCDDTCADAWRARQSELEKFASRDGDAAVKAQVPEICRVDCTSLVHPPGQVADLVGKEAV